ncbi:hypothetical protein M9194_09900 [Vibrio sp. S4M6]|uniref:hypothetical protein n=1 Tax=Vibrio sinus TaxID=2946865 RepID=UPI00202A4193|nr:hypothetical protein [Vibrio sinus]MCL9781738.1 hypothetical protein [Vibrio sinus]
MQSRSSRALFIGYVICMTTVLIIILAVRLWPDVRERNETRQNQPFHSIDTISQIINIPIAAPIIVNVPNSSTQVHLNQIEPITNDIVGQYNNGEEVGVIKMDVKKLTKLEQFNNHAYTSILVHSTGTKENNVYLASFHHNALTQSLDLVDIEFLGSNVQIHHVIAKGNIIRTQLSIPYTKQKQSLMVSANNRLGLELVNRRKY